MDRAPTQLTELKRLRYFLAVADTLNYREAAAALNISQPPLTQQIKLLEEEIGAQLFDRGKGHTTLTAAGQKLYEFTQRLFADAEQVFDEVVRISKGEKGSLSVGYTSEFIDGPLPEIMATMHREYCELLIRSELGATGDLVRKVKGGALDMCFVCPPVDHAQEDVAIQPVGEAPIEAVLPEGHELAREKQIELRALQNERFVLPATEGNTGYYIQLRRLFDEAGFWPNIVHHVTDERMRFKLVAAGVGVTVESMCRWDYAPPGVRAVELYERQAAVPLAVVFRPYDESAVASTFREMATKGFAAGINEMITAPLCA